MDFRSLQIRYTQGMNYIVGLFLLYMSEKEAFWALCQLMENSPFFMSKWFNQELTMVHTSDYQVLLLLFPSIDGKTDGKVYPIRRQLPEGNQDPAGDVHDGGG